MRYLSVCSGIEAATVAWHPLGWEPVALSEIEKFPSAALAHHYPDTPNWGDMTRFKEWPDAAVDVLVGGTPCQSFSVAGLRKGLDDPRGNLALTFLALAERYRPRWIVWENVPGVLSSSGGRDFGSFLGGLVELGYGFAYRVLDAQYFGVAQRRRRVFVVGCLGDWRRAVAVLFEPESLRGDSPPSREKGEGTAVSPALRARANSSHRADSQAFVPDISPALKARDYKGPSSDGDGDGACLVAHSLRAEGFDASEDGAGRGTPLVAVDCFNGQITGQVAATIGTSGSPVNSAGPQVMAFTARDYGADATEEVAPTMRSISNTDGHQAGSHGLAVAFNARQDPDAWDERTGPIDTDGCTQAVALRGREGGATAELSDVPSALRASQGGGDKAHVLTSMQVRRLTPRECERLQGFPDGYTAIPIKGKPAADGPRYKALGNSMAVPVMAWIGRRIQEAVG